MRTKLFTICCLLFVSFSVKAQEHDFSGYGTPSKDEIELKQCPFDKNADAIILLDEAISDYDQQGHLVTSHHTRIKILTNKGTDAANIKIPYYHKDDFEYIYKIDGMTINIEPEGKLIKQKLDRESIYDQKEDERWGIKAFAFPEVKAGSIVEYKYMSAMKNYGGLDKWVFQDRLPVLASKYMLNIIPNAEFAYRVSKRTDLPIIINLEESKGRIYFEMRNIPGLNDEPFIDAREDYLQKVIFQLSGFKNKDFGRNDYMNSWDDVIKELLEDINFGKQINKNIPGTADLMIQVAGMSSEKRMQVIYDHVRKNMSWNRRQSKYCSDGLKSIWKKRQGTNGEINLLLINLLKEAELEVYPILISERSHGKVNTDYPFIDQFNAVFACVTINNKKYFLDATDQFTPAHIIPYDILNTTGLIVNRKNGGLINITNESLQYDEKIRTEINVKDDGSFSGNVTVNSNDYARVMRVMQYREHKEEFLKKYFHKDGELLTIKDFEIVNLENDSLSLEQHCAFTSTSNSGDGYLYIPLALFSGFDKNPFIADNRFSNINFGYRRNINVVSSISLSKNYIVDVLPKTIKVINDEKDIMVSRQVVNDKENNLLYCNILIEFKNGLYPVDAYTVLKEFYKKMFNLLKEPIVLKKK